jgi:hypothetical protein
MKQTLLLAFISIALCLWFFAVANNEIAAQEQLAHTIAAKVTTLIETKWYETQTVVTLLRRVATTKYAQNPQRKQLLLQVAKILEWKKTSLSVNEEEAPVYYYKDNTIRKYIPSTQQKTEIISVQGVSHVDVYEDMLVYAQDQEGFVWNSDIFTYDMRTKQTQRITEKNNMASYTPYFIDDGKKIVYIRRVFANNTLWWWSVWSIDANGDTETAEEIVAATYKKENFADCDFSEENEPWYLGLLQIRVQNNILQYNEVIGCSAYAGTHIARTRIRLDGQGFFTDKFHEQNAFVYDDRTLYRTAWDPLFLADGSFVVNRFPPDPLARESIAYVDAQQNIQNILYDQRDNDYVWKPFSQMRMEDIQKIKGEIWWLYRVYCNFHDRQYNPQWLDVFFGDKYILYKTDLAWKIVPEKLIQWQEIFVDSMEGDRQHLSDIFFAGEYVIYTISKNGKDSIYVFNIDTQETLLVDDNVRNVVE